MSSEVQSTQQISSKLFMRSAFRRNRLPFQLAGQLSNIYKPDINKPVTSASGPPVFIQNELRAQAGLEVTVKMLHPLRERGSTGDRGRAVGQEEKQGKSEMKVPIRNHFHAMNVPLLDAKQAEPIDMKVHCKDQLAEQFSWRMEQNMLWQLFGQRGTADGNDNIFPPETDPTVSNPDIIDEYGAALLAPTYHRKLYAGTATSISGAGGTTAITANDVLKLSDLSKFGRKIRLNPMDPASYPTDDPKAKKVMPAHVGFVSPAGWATLMADAKTQGYDNLVANAQRFAEMWGAEYLFQDEMIFHEGILWRPLNTVCRFDAGSKVMVSADQADPSPAAQVVPNGVNVERCFVLGARALCIAFGSLSEGLYNFKYGSHENTETDKGASFSAWYDSCFGMRKVRLVDRYGRVEDQGVMCMDYAVPA